VVNSSRSCLLKTQDDVARLDNEKVSRILSSLS